MIYQDRNNTNCVKYNKNNIRNICSNENAEPFWVADMDFRSPEACNKALLEAQNHGLYGYPCFDDTKKIAQAFIKERHGFEINEDQIVLSNGVLNSLALLTQDQKGKIIVPFPAYKPFVYLCQLQKKDLVPWHLAYNKETCQFSLDFEALEKICKTGQCSLLIFCSPQNPSGLVFSKEELIKVASLCKEHNIEIICDEIHSDLCFSNSKHIPFVSLAKTTGVHITTLMAPSKTFNLAGEHFSLTLFDSPEAAKSFQYKLDSLFCSEQSYLGTTLARAAYKDGKEWLEDCISTLEENISYIDKFFKRNVPQIKVVYPKASFICFFDCSELLEAVTKDQQENPELYNEKASPEGSPLSRFFGVRCNVAVNAGPWFGKEYINFVRFNYATDLAHIKVALKRIQEGVQNLLK